MTKVHTYSRITTITTVQRRRKLPRHAVVKVAMGQPVKADDEIAALEIPQQHSMIQAAKKLKITPDELGRLIDKREGDLVQQGEVLAEQRGFLGFLGTRRATAPIDGKLSLIKDGKVLIEGGRKRVQVFASVPGMVSAIDRGRQITIQTTGAVIRAAWGHGGMAWGTLKMMDSQPGEITETGRFNIDHRGAIVAIGSPLTEAFIEEAAEIRVKGIIAASMRSSLIPVVEGLEFPVILTQGFGNLPMSERLLSLFNTYNGREIALDTSQPADWREAPPEIIILLESTEAPRSRDNDLEVKPGGKVRILQSPYLGEIGTIASIPDSPQQLPNGLWLPGVYVDVAVEKDVFVPFANLEYLS